MTLTQTRQDGHWLQCLAIAGLISMMFLWGVAGVIVVGSHYVHDLAGAEREADDILDYHVFYAAGRLVMEGRGGDLYDLRAIGEAETEVLGTTVAGEDIYPYLNPPFVALMLAPFTVLPPVGFALVLAAGNVALLLVVGRSLQGQLNLSGARQRWLFWLAYVTGFTVWALLLQQQFSVLVVTGWLGFVIFQMRGRENLSGFCLALALVKPQFVILPLLFLLYHRRWETLRAFLAIAVALVLMSVAVGGPSVLIDYPRYLMQSTDWSENGIFGEYMLGWQGLLVDITGDTTPPRALFLALSLPTVALAAWTWRGRWQDNLDRLPLLMAITLVASVMITPHLYLHDVLLVSLAIALAGVQSVRERGSLGPWGAVGLWFWVAQMPRSFFYYTHLPVLTVAMIVVLAMLVWRLKRSEAKSATAAPAIAKRAAA